MRFAYQRPRYAPNKATWPRRRATTSAASTVPPTCTPPLFPSVAIEDILPKLDVDSIVRVAHPAPKLVPVADLGLVVVPHPCSKVICADPARVHLPKKTDELLGFCLLGGRRLLGVGRCHSVQ